MFPKTETALAILRQTLTSCSKSIEASDYNTSVQSVEGLIIFLNSICDATVAEEHEPVDSQNLAIEILNEIHQYLASPALSQEIIDALAFEVPKAVARFACLSTRCLEVAEDVVDLFIGRCSPRDLLSILCDAMASPIDPFIVPSYFMPLLSGLTKVVVLIQRRHYEQVKTAVPVILKVLTTICSDDVDSDYENLFHRATGIAHSIREICIKMEGKDNKKLHDLLGLYVLQLMALVSVEMPSDISRCLPLVLELSDFLQHCELTYIGLLTGLEVDMISNVVCGDDGELGENCFSQVKLGAVLAVIWGYKASEVAVAAKADLTSVLMELQGNWTRRWEAVGMLKHLFSCSKLSWGLKQEGIKFLLCIMDGIVSHSDNDTVDYSIHMPTMYTSLQAIQMVIMYASDSVLRKNAFKAFRKLLADIPTCGRFDVLMALVKNSDSSSMIGILLDCIREEMRLEKATRNSSADGGLDREVSQSTPFWNPSVLELVEMVLRPPQGGPPSLPEYSDAVLSALNLYRFILITESTGNTNSSGVLSKDKLQKAYREWLLPLRTLVAGTVAESQKDDDNEIASDALCALNPVEFVLHRCIELVEEKLKHF